MMTATASSASKSSSHMPRYSLDNPMSRSPSPWPQIAKGADSDVISDDLSLSLPLQGPSISSPIPDFDNAGKKPAWNKTPNPSADAGPVMGAESWPALSVSRASSVKSFSLGLSDGSSSMLPPQAAESPSAFTRKQGPNASATLSDNHNVHSLKKPFKRSNSNISSSSSSSNVSAPGNVASPASNTIPSRDQTHSQRSSSYGGGNPQHRNSYRNRNGGSYPRGDGVHQQNHGNRKSYDHGNHTVYPHRNYNGRDVHMQSQRGLGHLRPQVLMGPPAFPADSSQYVAGPHPRPYSGPMLYPDYPVAIYMPHPPPESMAFVGQFSPQPFYVPGYDPMLFSKIVKQVDFYFSADNLSKDKYLRQQMDDEGWVPVSLIAGFRKFAELTNNVQIILDAVRSSVVVEVQGESMRRRGDWHKYVWPRDLRDPTVSTAQPAAAAKEDASVAAHLQNMKLSDGGNLQAEGKKRDAVQEDGNREPSASLAAAGTVAK